MSPENSHLGGCMSAGSVTGKRKTTGARRGSYFDTFPAVAVVGESRLKELRDVGISRGVTTASRFALSLSPLFGRNTFGTLQNCRSYMCTAIQRHPIFHDGSGDTGIYLIESGSIEEFCTFIKYHGSIAP